ncbi:MAG: DMT family transporter [Clostridia bacterium]|nr:DMT family transporter [Clostridia bacterium]
MKKGLTSATATALLLLTAMIWGFAFAAQRAAGVAFGSISIICLRSIIAFFVLIPVVMLFDRLRGDDRHLFWRQNGRLQIGITRVEWVGGFFCGLALGVASLLQQYGLLYNQSSGKTAFITALYVALVPVFGAFVGRRTSLLVWLGVLGSVGGAFLLAFDFAGGEQISLALGDLLVLLCAVVFAVQILVIDRFSPRCDGIRISLVQFLTGAVITLPFMLIVEGATLTPAAFSAGILPLLYLGVMSSGVAYTLQIIGQKKTHPAVASVVMSLESVFGLLGGAIVFGEQLEKPSEIAGCVVLFASVLLTQLGELVKKKEEKKL